MKAGFDCNVMVWTGNHEKCVQTTLFIPKQRYPEFNVYL